MSIDRSESMRRMNDDPEFAAARDHAARERILAERDRMQRLANIARRGVDVPGNLEGRWRELKQMKIPNKEAAAALRSEERRVGKECRSRWCSGPARSGPATSGS